jgi:hypothetical protein
MKNCQNGPFEPVHEMQEKVQKGDFLKKSLKELKKKMFSFPMNPLKAWNAKLEAVFFCHLKICTGSVYSFGAVCNHLKNFSDYDRLSYR